MKKVLNIFMKHSKINRSRVYILAGSWRKTTIHGARRTIHGGKRQLVLAAFSF
jgi:hypothetical protein